MEGRLLFKNCTLFRAEGRLRPGMAVVVEEGLITQVSPDAEVPVRPGDWEVACRGRLLGPGRVDCHAHLVGGLLAPAGGGRRLLSPQACEEREQQVATQLSASEVEVLTRLAAARALREGVTLAVEHLGCPGDVAGGLEAQARAAEQLGLRLVVGHATRGEAQSEAEAQVEANADFAHRRRGHSLVRGALGFHAPWTCGEGLLRHLARMREPGKLPLLFHLAEHARDEQATRARHGCSVVERLEGWGLLGPGVVAARVQALVPAQVARVARSGTFLALEPWHAALGGGGTGVLEEVLARRIPAGLGTGGQGSLGEELVVARVQVLAAARAGRLAELNGELEGALAWLWVEGPASLCAHLYGARCGVVEEGCLADLVVYDGVPAVEPGQGRVEGLSAWLARAPVAWTVVGGRVAVREGQLLGTDGVELAREAARALEAVWARARLPEGQAPSLVPEV